MGQDPEKGKPDPVKAEPPGRHLESLIQLHVAEYQALTTRNTYWITIQFSVWLLILTYVTLISAIWLAKPNLPAMYTPFIIWGSGILIQIALAGWYYAGHETYRNLCYVERDLRSMVQEAVGTSQFWQYEPFLAARRPRSPMWSESGPALGLIAALVIAVWLRHAFWGKELIGPVLNLPFTIVVLWSLVNLVKLRREFASATTK
jgi:hypothetical protein